MSGSSRGTSAPLTDTVAAAPRIERLTHGAVSWLMVERPGPAELVVLGDELGIHPLNLDDLLSRTERPQIDQQPAYQFVVLHFPVVLSRPRRLAAGELHLVLGRDYLATVHDGDLRPVVRLFEDARGDDGLRAALMSSPGRLAYAIVMAMIDATAPLVDRLSNALETLHDDIFGRPTTEPVRQLVALRREVIQLRRMLRPGPAIIRAIPRTSEMETYWGDAEDQLQRLVDYLDDVSQNLEALSHSHDQLNTYRMNDLIRGLTTISTVMLPLGVVTGIYGMNIRGLPWAESDWALEITLGLLLAVAVGMVALFRRRGWL